MELITLLLAFFIIGGVIITAVILTAEIKKHRPVKPAKCADLYIAAGEARMTVKEDSFLRTHTVRVRISSNSGPAGRR